MKGRIAMCSLDSYPDCPLITRCMKVLNAEKFIIITSPLFAFNLKVSFIPNISFNITPTPRLHSS
ncbi:TPA: hypothetical protein HA296_00300 [Candidatus Woesearchaeota archaeon]|nr:hypothetical protein [Candidatus Woesearchaeota archaeon]